MRKLTIILLFTCLMSFAKEIPKSDVSVEAYLFTPVALSEYEYYSLHPNHYEYQSSLLAMPGAEGFGKYTTGGRGGTVYRVTNYNDSGTGSLRVALEASGTRTVVFDVAGDFYPTGLQYIINDDNLTIAGETAPSPGVTIHGSSLSGSAYGGVFDIYASNIIIRYVTINGSGVSGLDAVRFENNSTPINDIIFDHVTFVKGGDENLSVFDTSDATFQNCMFVDAQGAGNVLFGADSFNTSFVGNYISHTGYRNIFVGYGGANESSEFINNVIYGYEEGHIVVYGNLHDALGNIWKSFDDNIPNNNTTDYAPNAFNNPDGVAGDGSIYFADNFQVNPHTNPLYPSRVTTNNGSVRVITNSLINTWETTQAGIEARVFDYLTGPGNSLYQDAQDAQAILDYTANTGSFTSLTTPSKTETSHPAGYDTDNDGMADAWEISRSGSIALTANGDDDSDGYTNIEEFFHYRAGNEGTGSGGGSPTPTGLKRNFFNKKKGFF